jgi:hypothetical protein
MPAPGPKSFKQGTGIASSINWKSMPWSAIFVTATFLLTSQGRPIMRAYATGGLVLIVLGIVMLVVHSFTYFTTDHVVGPMGYFQADISQPHTIFINPIAGIIAVAVGIGLMIMDRRRTAA